MHCNLRQHDAAQSLRALISSPVPSSKSLSLSVAGLERFYCFYVTLRCDLELWPVTLTFDRWPWTFSVCRLCRSQTLYEISSHIQLITRAVIDRTRQPRWMVSIHPVINFSWKSDYSVRRYKPNCGKMPYLALLKNPSKKFLALDPEADDFQNAIASTICTDTSVVKFSWRSVQ